MCSNARGPSQPNAVSPALLAATTETLRRLGPTAVQPHRRRRGGRGLTRHRAQRAGQPRPRDQDRARPPGVGVHRDHGRRGRQGDHLADQVAAAAVLICAHRQHSDSVAPRGINESILVLLLRNIGDDLVKRAIELWKPLVQGRPEQRRGRRRRRSRAGRRMDRADAVQFRAAAADGREPGQPARGASDSWPTFIVDGLTGRTQ